MDDVLAGSFVAMIAAWVIINLFKGMAMGAKGGNLTSRQKRRYITEKVKIENEFCRGLPSHDSRGLYTGMSGSFTDRTGKFNPQYREKIRELNEKYGLSGDDP